jgi:dihydropteroate synthase
MTQVTINDKTFGEQQPVGFLGAINLSPESFYKDSVKILPLQIIERAHQFEKDGADILDLGAMSTAPYLDTQISVSKEKERIVEGLQLIREEISIPLSVDTTRAATADVALKEGATIINDVTGFMEEPEIARVVADHSATVILGAHHIHKCEGTVIEQVIHALEKSVKIALNAGVSKNRIIIDPDIGFHRETSLEWYEVDALILQKIPYIKEQLQLPICIGVSRKSFIGHFLGLKDPVDRLPGSLGATSYAIMNGADIIRTHDVKATVEAVRIIEKIKAIE